METRRLVIIQLWDGAPQMTLEFDFVCLFVWLVGWLVGFLVLLLDVLNNGDYSTITIHQVEFSPTIWGSAAVLWEYYSGSS